MTIAIVTALLLATALVGWVAWAYLLRGKQLVEFDTITSNELGDLELELIAGELAVIVCHKIEEPKERLWNAVINNFSEGVNYRFVISRSQYAVDLAAFTELFDAMEKIGRASARVALAKGKLYEISCLPYDWDDLPYVFYITHANEAQRQAISVYRGNQTGEGIAERYAKVEPWSAKTIANTIMQAVDAFRGIRIAEEAFANGDLEERTDNVYPLPVENRSTRQSTNR